jgi:tol-pal system protein YbgF
MAKFSKTVVIVMSAITVFSNSTAHAGLFGDDEARQAILDIRDRIDVIDTTLNDKTDNVSSLNLSEQVDQLNREIAEQRGRTEVLGNEIFFIKKHQKDFYRDLDTRLCELESHRVSVDKKKKKIGTFGQEIYDVGLTSFRTGKYKAAIISFSNFLNLRLNSTLNPSAQYWLGCAYYALGEYESAIATQNIVIRRYPDDVKAAEALLNISSSYAEVNDKLNARKALKQLVLKYPGTPSAQIAKEKMGVQTKSKKFR